MATIPGIDWDCGHVPSTYINPPNDIPQFFLVRVKEELNPRFVIIKSSFVHRTDHNGPSNTKFWKLKVVDNPYLLIRGGETWHEDGTSLSPQTYYIERDATEVRPLGIYSTSVMRTAYYLLMPHLNYTDRVYEYTFTYPKNCLPPKFIYVLNDKDVHESYHFKGGVNMCKFRSEYLPKPATPIIVSRIPEYVFHAYVTNAIEKADTCPITLEPLTKQTVGCPPCGHLFDKDALRSALLANGKCPTCRGAASVSDIQTW